MADKWYTVASGNWSTAANWNGGTLPVDGDDIYMDGRAVTLDQDLNLPTAKIRTDQRAGGTAGGSLAITTTRNITIGELVTGTTRVISFDTPGITISFTGTTFRGSTSTNISCIRPNSLCTLSFTNCTFIGGNSSVRYCMEFGASWTAITFTNCSMRGLSAVAIFSTTGFTGSCSGTLNISQDASSASACMSISSGNWVLSGTVNHQTSASTVSVGGAASLQYTCTTQTFTGSFTGSSTASFWVFNTTATNCIIDSLATAITLPSVGSGGSLLRWSGGNNGRVTYKGDVTIGSTGPTTFTNFNVSALGQIKHEGTLTGAATGAPGIAGAIESGGSITQAASVSTGIELILDRIAPSAGGWMPALPNFVRFETTAQLTVINDAGSQHVIAATAALLDMPAPANVRSGTSYNLGTQTGTCAVPPAASVAFGVPVDATTGTAVLSGGTDWTSNEKTAIRSILGIPASGTSPDDPTVGILDTIRDNVGTKPTLSEIEASTVLAKEATVSSGFTNTNNLINALNNLSAKMNIFGAPLLEIPDSGTTVYAFTIVVRDDEDKLVNLDSSPTLAAANSAGTSRSGNLSAVSNPSTGRYTFTYSVANTHAKESLRIMVSGTVSAEARYIEWIGAVVDYDTLTTLQDIQTRATDIQSRLPASLSGGKMRSQVEGMDSNVVTAASIASDAGTEIANAVYSLFNSTPPDVNVVEMCGSTVTSVAGENFINFLNSAGGNSTLSIHQLQAIVQDWTDGGRLDLILDGHTSVLNQNKNLITGLY